MRVALIASTVVATVAVGISGAFAATTVKHTGRPDLAMHKISDVRVYPLYDVQGHGVVGRWAVRFTSVVDNLGPGDFIINAHRATTGVPCLPVNDPYNKCEEGDMTADQVVILPGGKKRTYRNVAAVYFDQAHYHWHLRAAERYELRRADGTKLIAKDVKTGFCFGDRILRRKKGPAPNYPGLSDGLATCKFGSSDPAKDGRRALSVLEGISAGWSDDYPSFLNGKPLEGQQLELTGLPTGRYLLINRANPLGRFQERNPKNNVASVLFALTWPNGTAATPAIRVLASCTSTSRCSRSAVAK
jgi:hypothetical protein